MNLVIEHLNQLAGQSATEAEALERMSLWVPSERVMVFRLELPKVSKRKLQEMLPWLLEEQLLGSPNEFEFIVGRLLEGGQSVIYVVEKSALSQWLSVAESASVLPERFAPDFLALPYEADRWTLYTDEGRLIVRTGVYEGFATDLDFGWQQLALMHSQLNEPVRISHLSAADIEIPNGLRNYIDSQNGKINWSFTELPAGLDILPGAYKSNRSSNFARWFPALTSLAVLLLFVMSYMLVQSWVWQRDSAVLELGIAETYQSLFSKQLEGPAVDVAKLAEAQLGLLEHQYIRMQTAPLVELAALDRVLSSCTDCSLMSISQFDQGIRLRLKGTPQNRSRLNTLEGWNLNWGQADARGFNTLIVQRPKQ